MCLKRKKKFVEVYSKLNEAKEIRELNAIPDSTLDLVESGIAFHI